MRVHRARIYIIVLSTNKKVQNNYLLTCVGTQVHLQFLTDRIFAELFFVMIKENPQELLPEGQR